MDEQSLRILIREKLANGTVPHNCITRVWGGAGNGEICMACDLSIDKKQFVMEGVGAKPPGR